MKELNANEKAVLTQIQKTIAEEGYAPSVRDLRDALGYKSTSTVQMYLDRLETYGYLRREEGKSRSLRLTEAIGVRMLSVLSEDGALTEETIPVALPEHLPEHLALRLAKDEEDEDTDTATLSYLILCLGKDVGNHTHVVRRDGRLCLVGKEEIDADLDSVVGYVTSMITNYL